MKGCAWEESAIKYKVSAFYLNLKQFVVIKTAGWYFAPFKPSKIPNRVSLSVYVILHLDPEGKYHVNDNGRADGHATGINKKQAYFFGRHL